jgi:hypothetical protein
MRKSPKMPSGAPEIYARCSLLSVDRWGECAARPIPTSRNDCSPGKHALSKAPNVSLPQWPIHWAACRCVRPRLKLEKQRRLREERSAQVSASLSSLDWPVNCQTIGIGFAFSERICWLRRGGDGQQPTSYSTLALSASRDILIVVRAQLVKSGRTSSWAAGHMLLLQG